MPEPAMPLNTRLAELKAEVAEFRGRARSVAKELRDLAAERDQLRNELVDAEAQALADGAKANTAKLRKRLADVIDQLDAADAGSRLRIAEQAAERKAAELSAFVMEHQLGLLEELRAPAEAAQRAFTVWLEGFDAVAGGWSGVGNQVAEVLRLAGRQARLEMSAWDPQGTPLRSAVRQVRGEGVPLPHIATFGPVRVRPADHPDPNIRAAALAREAA